jgi:hypothetical protein
MTPRWIRLLLLALALAPATPARAHEFALESVMTGFVKIEPHAAHLVLRLPLHVAASVKLPLNGREIDLARADLAVQEALAALARDVTLWEGDRPLVPATSIGRLALPSDRSFDRYEDAVAAIARPLPPGTTIYAGQGYLDAHVTYPIASPASRFSIRTAIAPELKEYLKLALRYLPLDEPGRPMLVTSRSGRVSLNPAWHQAATGFAVLGFEHILGGFDHLLFLLCLVVPLAGLRRVLVVVSAFTVAHSATLVAAAYGGAPGGAWFPPFVETAIAASIVYTALENVAGVDLRRRWVVTALFGLVHGFGFSYGLKENLQFAGPHLLVSLLSFNVGIEAGQLAVLGVVLPALALLRRGLLAGRAGIVVVSGVLAHTGWHWMLDRGEVLWKTPWPRPDAAGLAALARWSAAALLAWGVTRFLRPRAAAIRSRALRWVRSRERAAEPPS